MEAEERQALSIESQLNEMRAIAKRENLTVVDELTESHSAKDSGEREVFNRVIAGIRKGKYNAILTWAPDRLSRNAGDLGRLVDLMDQGGLREIQTYGQKFTNSPNDKFLLMILGSQAKLENDNKGVNVKRGLRTRVEMGLRPSPAPLGYFTAQTRDRLCEVDLDPYRAPIIKQMFEKVAYESWSTHDVLRWLREMDFRSPKGVLINLSTVLAILHRPFYYGSFEYPVKSGNWYKGKHTPIISKELFDLVKEHFEQYGYKKTYDRMKVEPLVFIRLLKCGKCGSGISGYEKYKKYASGKIGIYRYYTCTRSKDRDCFGNSINEQELTSQLADMIDHIDLDLIGMREELEQKIEKFYKYESYLTGEPVPDRSKERKEIDLRKYAKTIFENGGDEEKREILRHLKSHLILNGKKVSLDISPAK